MQNESVIRVRNSISGLRWAGFHEFLLECATIHNVKYRTLERDKGLLRETIYFEVEGKPSDIRAFGRTIDHSIQKYNKEK